MKKLQIDEENARELYKTASPEFKTMLEDTFGKDFFTNITDRVKTFEDACKCLGKKSWNYNLFDLPSHVVTYIKLTTIIQALNEGWIPNFQDKNECKYYVVSSARGFFTFMYDGAACTIVSVGARLLFKSRELAEYAAKQFPELYKQFLLNL